MTFFECSCWITLEWTCNLHTNDCFEQQNTIYNWFENTFSTKENIMMKMLLLITFGENQSLKINVIHDFVHDFDDRRAIASQCKQIVHGKRSSDNFYSFIVDNKLITNGVSKYNDINLIV